MADWKNYLEGDYDGTDKRNREINAIRAYEESEDISTAKKIAAEIKKTYKEYEKSEKQKEYLIDGAVLVCNKATLENFKLLDKTEVPLVGLKNETEQEKDERQETILHIKNLDSSIVVGKYRQATVVDCKRGELVELDEKKEEEEVVSFTANVYPFRCNCMEKIDRVEEQEMIKANMKECLKNGVCQYLMKLNDEWENMPSNTENFYEKRMVTVMKETEDGQKKKVIKEADCITMTSMLFCRHGGLITPIWSGQIENMDKGLPKKNVWGVWRFSKAGMRALMEIEVVNTVARDDLKCLVMDGKKLKAIKPHDAKDGTVTVGFGDSLQEGDLEFYHAEGITKLTSDNIHDFAEIKDVEIPVEVCYKKLLIDTGNDCHSLLKQFGNHFLTQNQLDALIIARYNCGPLGDDVKEAVFAGAERDELYDCLFAAHNSQNKLISRINQELDIYFGCGYEIEQGLHNVIVEQLDSY